MPVLSKACPEPLGLARGKLRRRIEGSAQHDGFVRTGGDTEVTAVAAAGVNEGWFIRVQLDDGLALADVAGQALVTGVT